MNLLSDRLTDERPVLASLAAVLSGLVTFFAAVGLLGGTVEADAGTEATWTRELRQSNSRGAAPSLPPAVAVVDGTLFVASDDAVAALEPDSGSLRWTQAIPTQLGESDASALLTRAGLDQAAFAVGRQGHVVETEARVLDVRDGSTVASIERPGGAVTRLASAGGRLFSLWSDLGTPVVAAHDAATGDLIWEHPLSDQHATNTDIAVTDDSVFVTVWTTEFDEEAGVERTGEQFVVAFDPATGDPRWRVDADDGPFALDVGETGAAFVAHSGGDLVAYDAATGEVRWRWSDDSGAVHDVAAAGGLVAAVVDTSGRTSSYEEPSQVLVVLDEEGREVWRSDPLFSLRFRLVGDRLVVAAAHGPNIPGASSGQADLAVIQLPSGETLWERSFPSETPWDPAGLGSEGDVIFVSQSNGVVHALGIADGAQAWTVDPFGATSAEDGPAATADAVHLLTADGALRSFGATDGAERWSTLHSIRGASPPAVDGRHVYAATGLGIVRAYDRRTGEVAWETERRHEALDEPAPRPAVAGDAVVVADPDGTLLVLEAATGDERWSRTVDDVVGVAGQEQQLLVAYGDGRLEALDAVTGEEQWTSDLDTSLRAGPFPSGSTVVVITATGRIVAVEASSGEQRWSHDTGAALLPPPASDAGAYYALAGRRLVALDVADGAPLWEAEAGDGAVFTGRPVAVQGQVFVAATDLTVRVLSAATGEEVDVIEVGVPIRWSAATPGGLLVVMTADGELRAYR